MQDEMPKGGLRCRILGHHLVPEEYDSFRCTRCDCRKLLRHDAWQRGRIVRQLEDPKGPC